MSLGQELSASVRRRLTDMTDGQQAMFACAVAERLLSRHEGLPAERQWEFTVSLRPLLDADWDMACGDQTRFTVLKQGLGEFYLSEYCHNDGQDGPGEQGAVPSWERETQPMQWTASGDIRAAQPTVGIRLTQRRSRPIASRIESSLIEAYAASLLQGETLAIREDRRATHVQREAG